MDTLEAVIRQKLEETQETVDRYNGFADSLKGEGTPSAKRQRMQWQRAAQDYQLQADVLHQVLYRWERRQ